mmetsp:Transcript_51582/g.85541  ORF Transcript_51582/g.85541 Transcript_51582/m.85541 type:complete len:309 (-) Transcript_51582:149-1075(-)
MSVLVESLAASREAEMDDLKKENKFLTSQLVELEAQLQQQQQLHQKVIDQQRLLHERGQAHEVFQSIVLTELATLEQEHRIEQIQLVEQMEWLKTEASRKTSVARRDLRERDLKKALEVCETEQQHTLGELQKMKQQSEAASIRVSNAERQRDAATRECTALREQLALAVSEKRGVEELLRLANERMEARFREQIELQMTLPSQDSTHKTNGNRSHFSDYVDAKRTAQQRSTQQRSNAAPLPKLHSNSEVMPPQREYTKKVTNSVATGHALDKHAQGKSSGTANQSMPFSRRLEMLSDRGSLGVRGKS